jgi:hypothetical protein
VAVPHVTNRNETRSILALLGAMLISAAAT